MLNVSKRTLAMLAAAVWYGGSIALLLKGSSLLGEAKVLHPDRAWSWTVLGGTVLLGTIKARFIFGRSCRRNLDRIAALDHPRLLQFFSPRFFIALAAMIAAGTALSRLAHGNYAFLAAVALLDLSIGLALLLSSVVFWRQKAFSVSLQQ